MKNKENVIANVQRQTGHTFKNPDLLIQAFTRSSYARENGGEDNEVLEFIGDKALDFAIVRLLISKYGKMADGEPADKKLDYWELEALKWKGKIVDVEKNEFVCSVDEDELTNIKSRMVQKRHLAARMDEMGFSEHILMGKGDVKNDVGEEKSVKEDLFEAILGAVVIDSDWNFEKICSVVEAMIEPAKFFTAKTDDNYVRLIQEWEENKNGCIPWFWFKNSSNGSICHQPFNGISQAYDATQKINFICELKLLDKLPIFRGFGISKSEARMNVCKLAYEYLDKNGLIPKKSIKDEIENPNKEDSIGQLEILARRGYFSIPTYNYSMEHDENGNPVWSFTCIVKDKNKSICAISSSKKDAKKSAAYEMLLYLLNEEDE